MIEKLKIKPKEFQLFKEYIYHNIGISLSEQKVSLVETRLSKRLKKLNLTSFNDYYNHVKNDKSNQEILYLIDAISTNVTSFFREAPQWEFLSNNLENILSKTQNKTIRIWSAACSTGQEPYTIAIFLMENIPNISNYNIKILATDISQEVIQKAQKGIYTNKELESMPNYLIQKYFHKIDSNNYEVSNKLKNFMLFRMFNLVYGNFSIFKNRFDLIFCRNVMIYFNSETQIKLVSRFRKILKTDGLLFVGHSESLTKNSNEFKLKQSSIYKAI